MLRGEHSQAIPAANAAIELARTAGSAVSEAHAMATLGTSTVLIGQTEEGLRILRDAFDRTQALENAYDDVGRSYANLTSALLIAGRPEESLAKAVEGIAWAKSVGAWRGYGRFVTGNAMDAAVALGRWDEAEAWLDELLAHDAVGVNRMGMIAAGGTFLAQRGRLDLAAGLLTEGRRLVEPLQEAQFTAPVYVGLVELALTRGQLEEASAAAAEGVERLLRTEDRHYLADVLVAGARAEADLAEMLRARKDAAGAARAAERAGTYADRLECMATSVAQPEAFGGQLAADLAIGLAEAARAAGSDAADLWSAANSRAGRKGPWMEAYTLYRFGEALLSAHASRREAESPLVRAHAIAQGLAAQPLVGWIEAAARRGRVSLAVEEPAPDPSAAETSGDDSMGLTTREREVLQLVAEGYTNRRIAESLFISESTAGVHVSNILGKLGVATRTEAATVATRLGLIRSEVAAEC
jgi:ATP/maltotriose-dependent transcriptional regulator MalT